MSIVLIPGRPSVPSTTFRYSSVGPATLQVIRQDSLEDSMQIALSPEKSERAHKNLHSTPSAQVPSAQSFKIGYESQHG